MACDNRAFVTRRETHCVMDNGGAKRTREDAAPPEKRACGETLSAAQARAVEIAAAASTGVAAFLVRGQTLHSFAGTGVGSEAQFGMMSARATGQKRAKRWVQTAALIVDEISMINAAYLDLLDRVARRNRASRAPFGGMQVIVVGDFAQLAPVEGDFAFTAKCWDALFGATTVVLTEVFRQRDAEFVAALHALRTNTLAPAQFALLAAGDKPVDGAVRLFAVNAAADECNQRELALLPGAPVRYAATDQFDKADAPAFPVDATVVVRPGARVMLRANIDVAAGLVNGACGTVVAATPAAATVEFDTGRREVITPETFTAGAPQPDGTVRDCTRTQMQLMLAWAFSIHKSQGTTLERCEVDLGRAWAAGQVYVALSRAASREGLCVRGLAPAKIKASAAVRQFYARYEK